MDPSRRKKSISKLQTQNLNNIRRRLKSGKTLTRAEQIALERATKQAATPTRARKLQLAMMLNISRPTLDEYLKMPGAPIADGARMFDVEAVAKFVAANAKTAAADPSTKNWRAEKTRIEAENLAFDLQVKRGDYFLKSDAVPVLAALVAEVQQNLREKFELELPPRYVGKTMIECQMMNQEAIDLIVRRIKAGGKPLTS
jgi:hypothetical protein